MPHSKMNANLVGGGGGSEMKRFGINEENEDKEERIKGSGHLHAKEIEDVPLPVEHFDEVGTGEVVFAMAGV